MGLTVHTESPSPDRVVVHIAGELDMSSAGRLRQDLLAAVDDPAVTVVKADLSGVTFIDSTGIGVLIATNNAATRAGRRFVVTRASAPVIRVLRIVGVTELLGLPAQATSEPG